MANMSYCRFQNTRYDMEDCLIALRAEKQLSRDEAKAGHWMFDDILSYCRDAGIHCFAALRLNTATRTLSINFCWLQSRRNNELDGWGETVPLPYDALMAFVTASAQEGGPKNWRVLSLQATMMPRSCLSIRKGCGNA